MRKEPIEKVIEEAKHTIEAAEEVLREAEERGYKYGIWGSKATGTLRRRSMDLTRALAEMRKP
jgi:hypothetical protein